MHEPTHNASERVPTQPSEKKPEHLEIFNSITDSVASFPITTRALLIWNSLRITERVTALVLIALVALSFFAMIRELNKSITVEVPLRGGSLHEGMVGSPRFVNPILAVSETDRSLTSLIYAGLTRTLSNGDIVPELAESYTQSDNGKEYTFILRPDAQFHDGTTVTADDVLFTIQKTSDPIIKSPRRADWEGVHVEKRDDRTIVFTLEKPYAPFLANTTLGILPKHAWSELTDEEFIFSNKNIAPIGAGPYVFTAISYDTGGIPFEYTLKSFDKYSLGEPYISTLLFSFYHSTEDLLSAWNSHDIDTVGGLSPKDTQALSTGNTTHESAILPRVFAIFFNQTHNAALADLPVRKALQTALEKDTIIDEVLSGYAVPLSGPLPNFTKKGNADLEAKDSSTIASDILTEAGWKIDATTRTRFKDNKELIISLATANNDELKAIAEKISAAWGSIGVRVKIELFETGDLNQSVLRPRAFDALLFGEVTGREPDLFAFWHSSQRNDPGLNIAQYSDKKADMELEKARTTSDPKEKQQLYAAFAERLSKDVPAIFMYAPQYTYLHQYTTPHVVLAPIMEPYERFSDVHAWYVESERVWRIFVD